MKRRNSTPSIRAEYEAHGVADFYRAQGDTYANPHEQTICEVLSLAVKRWQPNLSRVLDLACGSGEVTLALRDLGCQHIEGIDPYTGEAYLRRTGQVAEPLTFEQIAGGALVGRRYSLIVASFALHLVEKSRLPLLAMRLAEVSPALWVITPHKRPAIRPEWGWRLEDEFVHQRVRVREYVVSVKQL